MTSETSSKSVVTCRSQDGLALLQIDDGKANTIQPVWCDEMMRCMDRVEREDVSALIISGRPGFLSAGLDLRVFPKLRGPELMHAMNLFVSTMKRLFLFPKPVIVAINAMLLRRVDLSVG